MGGEGTGNGQFSYLAGIVKDASNNIYALDNGSVSSNDKVRIQKFDSEGTFLGAWGSQGSGNGQFNSPRAIAIDPGSGDIYIVDNGIHQGYIQKFKVVPSTDTCPAGTTQISSTTAEKVCFVTKWSVGPTAGYFATSAAVDSKGNVYVPIGGTPWVEVYDSLGKQRLNWALSEEYNKNYYIRIDSNNNYYILDFNRGHIKKYDSSGAFITNLDLGVAAAETITVDQSDTIYVGFLKKISKFIFANPCPTGTSSFASGVCLVSEWNTYSNRYPVKGIAVDNGGIVYAGVGQNIQKFSPSGISPGSSPTITTPLSGKRVFVTGGNKKYNGDLKTAGSNVGLGQASSGVDGADKICQARANEAGLGSTWKAWISDGTTSAADRLTHENVPYLSVPGVFSSYVIADNWNDLTDGSIKRDILSAFGHENNGYVWTNTLSSGQKRGTSDNDHCSNWTTGSTYSYAYILQNAASDTVGSTGGSGQCNYQGSLYCFEQGTQNYIAPTPTFVPTSTPTQSFPTAFRVSNDEASFSSANPPTEQLFDQNGKIIDWRLSEGAGGKTIYGQFKVDGVWGPVLTATVNYVPVSSPSPAPTTPTLTTSTDSIGVGQSLSVSWTNSSAALDWVGLYAVATPQAGQEAAEYLDWKWTGTCTRDKGTTIVAAGSCEFTMPVKGGSYEFRMFSNNSNTYITKSASFSVNGSSLSVNPSSTTPGGTATVSWTNSTAALDWIGLYPSSTAQGAGGYKDWKYTGNCIKTTQGAVVVPSGSCIFTIPTNASGDYEFRMFSNNSNTQIAKSASFQVSSATTYPTPTPFYFTPSTF